MNYLELLLSFFQIGLLSFGGGMAALPLISQQVVDKHGWLTMGEFTDLITIPAPSVSIPPPLWGSGWRESPGLLLLWSGM